MSILDSLMEYSALFYIKSAPTYKRARLKDLNLKNRIIGIVGAKGVGKTPLLLQFMKKQELSAEEMMYISVDHPLMSTQHSGNSQRFCFNGWSITHFG